MMKYLFCVQIILGCIFLRADVRELVNAGKVTWAGNPTVIYLNADDTTASADAYDHIVLKFTDTTTSGTLTLAEGVKGSARVLVVGGGGAGANPAASTRGGAGGGGAGGYVEANEVLLSPGDYDVCVGRGGVSPSEQGMGGNGGDSCIQISGTDMFRAVGGGGGGIMGDGASGGSGGGGSKSSSSSGIGGVGMMDQGSDGGIGLHLRGGAGGGGAGGEGQSTYGTNLGADGGSGLASSITGVESYYAAGGGGGSRSDTGGIGGSGIGGNGGGVDAATAGIDGTGSGGGGGCLSQPGGNGGSGVVIVRITQLVETKVPVPIIAEKTYTGENQVAFDFGVAYVYLSGVTNAMAVGTYSFCVAPASGLVWTDGSSGGKTITWTIAPAVPDFPIMGFRNVGTFRGDLSGLEEVPNVPSREQQPLCNEPWGVQCEIYGAHLPDDIDFSRTPRVKLHWFNGTFPWGYDNWKDNASAHSAWLSRAVATDESRFVYRSSIATSPEAVVQKSTFSPTYVQYMLEVVFYTKDSTVPATNFLSRAEWGKGPEWYHPLDLNAQNGGANGSFAAYNILDNVAPGWAWINEVNVFGLLENWRNTDEDCQFIEIAHPLEADMSGWTVRLLESQVGNNLVITNVLAKFGSGGLAGRKQISPEDAEANMVFSVIANEGARSSGRLKVSDGTLDAVWNVDNPTLSFTSDGVISFYDPMVYQLVRTSGIVEHEIMLEGTNFLESLEIEEPDYLYEMRDCVTNNVANSFIILPGYDYGGASNSLGVVRNSGHNGMEEPENDWTHERKMTPGHLNVGQTINSVHPTPCGEYISVTLNVVGGHVLQWNGDEFTEQTTASFVRRGSARGLTLRYMVDEGFVLETLTTNGVEASFNLVRINDIEPYVYEIYDVGARADDDIVVVATAKFIDSAPEFTIENGVLTAVELNGATEVVIPDGVTSIGASAFKGCSGLTSVTTPASVTNINDYAFYGCSALRRIDIPESVITVGQYAFAYCSGLREVSIGGGNLGLCSFAYCQNLENVTIGGNVSVIGFYAFDSDTSLTNVHIVTDGVPLTIAEPFVGTALTALHLPARWIAQYSNNPLGGCDTLVNVTIASENPVYAITNGILVSVDYKTMRGALGSLETVNIPPCVEFIGFRAFQDLRLIREIVIPDTVHAISSQIACECPLLESIWFGSGIVECPATSNSDPLIWGCHNLAAVYFSGNAPTNDTRYIYDDEIPSNMVTYVKSGSNGWGVDIPGIWNGRAIEYFDEGPQPIFTIENGVLTAVDLNGVTEVVIPNTVTTIGNYAFSGCSGLTSVTIPSSVKAIGWYAFNGCSGLTSVTIHDGVTSIGINAFYNCSNLTSVIIPNSVTNIEHGAFEGCTKVKDMVVPGWRCGIPSTVVTNLVISEGVTNIKDYAFAFCSSLTSVTIPSSVKAIGWYAFNGCSGLTSVTIGDGVESIGEYAFYGCSGLTSVTIPSSVKAIGGCAFTGCSGLTSVTIHDGVTSIGAQAFYNCTNLTSVTMPNSVTSIGAGAFRRCPRLANENGFVIIQDVLYDYFGDETNLAIPDGVAHINGEAFYCRSLTSVTIPDGVTSIGDWAFAGCGSLTSVTIPDSVTSIGAGAFLWCQGLANENGFVIIRDVLYDYFGQEVDLSIPNTVKSIGAEALAEGNGFHLMSVIIPESVTNIEQRAFAGCSSLTNVTIGAGVTSIGNYAFSDCRSLTSVTIPDSVVSIGDGAFEMCESLEAIIIPGTVLTIGNHALYYCESLASVTIGNGVASIGNSAFCGCRGLTSVTIPDSVMSVGDAAFDIGEEWQEVKIPQVLCNGDALFRCFGPMALTCIVISDSVTTIGDEAFMSCQFQSMVIPASVTNIGERAIRAGEYSPKTIVFEGNAPMLGQESFLDVSTACVVRVGFNSTGWGVDVPGTWNGLRIEYAEGENPPSGGTKTASATSLDDDPDNYTEGDVVHYRTALSSQNEIGSTIYAFLLCNEDVDLSMFGGTAAKAIIKDTNVAAIGSAGLMISANGTYANGAFSVLNNGHYSFSVVLCTTRSYDPQYRLAGYDTTEKLDIIVYNREPDFLTVYLNGFESESDGCTFPVQYLRGQVQTIQPEFDDVIYDLKHSFSYRWTASCGGRVVVDGLVMHDTTGTVTEIVSTNDSGEVTTIVPDGMNINEVPFVYNFPVPGVWSVSIQGKDCDMESYPDSSYTISFPVCDYPMIEVSAQDLYSEDDKTASIDVGLRYYEADEDIVVKLTVTPPEGTNPGAFVLDNAYKTVPIGYPALAENEYYLSFDTAQTISVRIASMDGTMRSESRGFAVKAEVVTSSDSGVPGKTWADIYVPSALKVYVGNVAPILGYCTAENANAWMVAGGVATSFPIKWSIRSDVVPDFTNKWANGEGPGIKVSFRGCDNATTFYVTDTNDWSGTFIPDFGSRLGANYVTMSIEDKDGGMQVWTYRYEVMESPLTPDFTVKDGVLTAVVLNGATEVVIPNTVTTIGDSAFSYCSELTSVTIPDGVISIGDYAFWCCSGLTTVTISHSVMSIGYNVFGGCSSLTSITVDEDNPNYSSINDLLLTKDGALLVQGVNGDVVIPDGVTSIGAWAFHDCIGLTSVMIPDSVMSIGDCAFAGCSGLTSVTIPDSVTSIGSCAFYGCDGLADDKGCVVVRNVLYSYSGVDSDIAIPVGVTSIGADAFYGCSGLTSVTIPDSVVSIGEYAFDGCSGLTGVTIPDSVTNVGRYAFNACSGLTGVMISDSVMSIGDYVFGDCSGLTSVMIPDSVTSIGYGTFYGCSSLASAYIPSNVKIIGENAFGDCEDLADVVFEGDMWAINMDINSAFYGTPWLAGFTIDPPLNDAFADAEALSGISGGVTGVNVGATIEDSEPLYEAWGSEATVWYSWTAPSNGVVRFDTFGSSFDTVLGVYTGDSLDALEVVAENDNADDNEDYTSAVVFKAIAGHTYHIAVGGYGTAVGHIVLNWVPYVSNPRFDIEDGVLMGVELDGATEITIPDGVTCIGGWAFADCSGLTSVTIPDSVASIGTAAFSGCNGLTSVTIPNSVTSIEYGAFAGCSGLTSVVIPNSVTSIGTAVFSSCGGLMSISVGSGNANYKSVNGLLLSKDGKTLVQGVNGDVTIPDSVTSIGDYAFAGCSGLTSVTIPDSVTSIGDSAFCGCSSLTSVTIPDSVTSIGFGAFRDCEGLADSSGFVIVRDALYGYFGDESDVVIPNHVTSIGDYAFAWCSDLTSVTIPDSVTSIGDSAFRDCSSLTSVTIPDSVASIGEGAFSDCEGLADSSGFVIVRDALYGYFGDESDVVIPNHVTSIGPFAFEGCSELTSVAIPNSVTSIGDYAFYGSGLTNVSFSGNAPEVGDDVFAEVDSDCVVYVRRGTTGWGVEIPGTWNGLRIEYFGDPMPDLAVAGVLASSSAFMPDDTVTVQYVERNIGATNVVAAWTDRIVLEGEDGTRVNLKLVSMAESLDIGQCVTNTVQAVIPDLVPLAGRVRFVVAADVNGEVEESNESNNEGVSEWMSLGKKLYLTAASDSVKENMSGGVRFTVRRSGPVDEALAVGVGNTDAASASVPATVTIPAGSVSTIFTVAPIDNTIVDGTRVVSVSVAADGFAGAFVPLTILDDEVPKLTVALDKTSIREGDGVITATVTREGATDEPLTVYISGTSGSRASYPSSVVIPAGATSVTFDISVPNNDTAQVASDLTLRASSSGYQSSAVTYTVEDDDVPGVILTIAPEVVQEGGVVRATLMRADTSDQSKAITVRLTASNPNEIASMPSSVTIPARTAGREFYIYVADDGLDNGDREITIDGSVLIESCGCNGQPSSGDAITATIGIIDNDGPSLSLRADPATMKEGLNPAGYLVLSHNSTLTEDLTVRIWIDAENEDEISIPETVTIHAGENTVRIPVATLDDGVEDGGQLVSVYAEVDGDAFAPASTWLQVSDQNLPDLTVDSVETVSSVVAMENLAVTFTVTNIGFMARSGTIPYAVHVVKGENARAVSSATLVKSGTLTGGIAVGGALVGTVSLAAPELPGDYRVAIVIDPDGTILELDSANNSGWSSAFTVGAAYTATAQVEGDVFLPGETVEITGTATRANGTPAANVGVDVYVLVDGTRRTLSATTLADGSYSVVFPPTSGEAGNYTIGACYPGVNSSVAQDSFCIPGLKRGSTANIIWDYALGDSASRTVTIQNRSSVPLTGLTVTFRDKPEECELVHVFADTIPANGSVTLTLTATAVGVTEQVDYSKFYAHIEAAEGVSLDFPLYFHSQTQKAFLRATPSRIDTTMAIGHTRYVDVTIVNDGKGDSGAITATIPSVDWLRIVAGASINNLTNGESAVITLALSPTVADNLTFNNPLSGGKLAVNCANGTGCSIPLKFTPVSEAMGGVRIDAIDDGFYTLESAPHLSNATVRISNPYTGVTIATGVTDENGLWSANDIPEGTYQLTITAPRHSTYAEALTIEPSRTAHVTAFLQFQAISVNWDVVRTEIEDEYDVTLVLEYETNVPVPVVKVTMPDKFPEPEVGQPAVFRIVYENIGKIPAKEVQTAIPEMPEGVNVKRINENPTDIAAGGVGFEDWVFTKTITGSIPWGCSYWLETAYRYECGPDGRTVKVPYKIQQTDCPIVSVGYTPSPTTNPSEPSRTGSGSGWVGIGGAFVEGGPTIREIKTNCKPDVNAIASALDELHERESEWMKRTGFTAAKDIAGLHPYLPLSCVDFAAGIASEISSNARDWINGLPFVPDNYYSAYSERNAYVGQWFVDLLFDTAGCVTDIAGAVATYLSAGTAAPLWGAAKKAESGLKIFVQKVAKSLPYLKDVMDSGIDLFQNVVQSTLSGADSIINGKIDTVAQKPYEDIIVAQGMVEAQQGIIDEVFGNMSKRMENLEYTFVCDVMREYGEAIRGERDVSIDTLRQSLKNEFSDGEIEAFASRLNRSANNWRETGRIEDGDIDWVHICELSGRVLLGEEYIRIRGYQSVVDMTTNALSQLQALVDANSSAVCASVTLKLSQTLAMTREAFDGTLTLYNGNTTTPITNLKLDVSVLDEDGNECKDLFEIFANGTSGDMSDGSALAGGLSVSANGTGSAMIRFIPERSAAPTEEKLYRFGGTVTYTDPFSGETATVKLTPVSLTVSPSPYLHLDYFVQRDVFADDPFTPDVVEASMPSELAVLVRNVGGGDANRVTIASAQPEMVQNEKGLSVAFNLRDYTLDASALNGSTAHLGLNTVSLGTIEPNESKVAQWWLTSTLEGHFVGMSATVTPVNSWNTPDTTLVDPDVGVHKLVRSIVADGDALPDFLVCDGSDLYGKPNEIYTSAGDRLAVYVASVATSATLPVAGEIALPIMFTPARSGWNYGYAAIPGIFGYTISRIVRGDGSEIPLRNAWITDRTFRDGTTPLLEDRLHIIDEFASNAAQSYTVYLAAKVSDVPEAATFEGVTGGTVEYAARDAVTVVFSKPIDAATFTVDDLTIAKQGAYLDDLSALTIEPTDGSGTRFAIGNLSALCSDYGRYELTVQCAGIADLDGNLGRYGKSVAWTYATSGSVAPQLVELVRKMSDGFGGMEYIASFDRGVNAETVTLANWTLRRNGSDVSLTGATLAARSVIAPYQFVLSGIDEWLTQDGEYELYFSSAGVTDEAGHAASGSKSVSWTVDATPPAQIADLAISPDGGFSDTDGVTYTGALTVTGTLPEAGLSVEIVARYVGGGETVLATLEDEGGVATQFSQNITLPGSGNVTLVVRLTDAAGNSSDTEKSVFVDGIALTGTLTGANEDEGVVTTTATLTFSAKPMEADVTFDNFALTRDGEAVALEGVTFAKVDDMRFTLTGLDSLCAEDGVYVLTFNGAAVRKYTSGLLMGGSLVMRWRYENPDREPPTVTVVRFDGETPHEAYTNGFSTVAVTFSEAVNVPELIANGLIGRAARIDLLDAVGAVTGCVAAVRRDVDIAPYQWDAESNMLSWQIDPFTVPAGSARLMLDAGLIADLAGNRLAADANGQVAHSTNGMRTYTLSETVLAQVNAQAMPMWYNGELYVGEKTADNKGKIRRYAANGSWTYLQSEGVDIEIPAQGCQGASVAFADMDGDGVAETYVGTATGNVLKYPGGETIASLGTNRAMPYAYDIDGDGCDELVVGGMDGRIRVISLDEDSSTYSMTVLADVNGAALTVPNGRAAPIVSDINHDGLADIVSGDTAGNVWAYLGADAASASLPVHATPISVFTNNVGLADRSRLGYGDVNDDGIEDLIVGRSDGSVVAMLGVELPSPCVEFMVAPLPIGMAVNADELEWTTDGAAEWKGKWNRDASDELHDAECGTLPNGTNAWLVTTVEGPGTMVFKWRSALASRNTKYQFMVDGEVKGMLTGTNDWTEVSCTVFGDRAHEVKWRLMTGRSGSSAGDWVALDCVVWTPAVPPTLAEALNTNLVWTTEGDVLWRGVARESLTDSRDAWAVVSGLGDDGTSAVQTRVYGSGVLLFDWAIFCEEDYDWMELTVDGEVRDYITGCADWISTAVEIVGDGWHVVCWEYVKDELDDLELAGENIAMLDNVIWNSDEIAPEDSDLIPAISLDTLTSAVDAKVESIGFADAAVKMAIGGHAEEYMLFKAWADVVRDASGEIAGELAVVDNDYAAAAFLLGAERLFENEPTIEIGEVVIAEGESTGTTAVTVAVTVKDGGKAVAVDPEKVAAMFEATRDLGDWTGAALVPQVQSLGKSGDAMRFTVTPGDGSSPKAFLRIRK